MCVCVCVSIVLLHAWIIVVFVYWPSGDAVVCAMCAPRSHLCTHMLDMTLHSGLDAQMIVHMFGRNSLSFIYVHDIPG